MYPTTKMQKSELLSSLTKVALLIKTNHSSGTKPFKGSPQYNAYEKDIAVVNLFFGESTVFGIIEIFVLIDLYF